MCGMQAAIFDFNGTLFDDTRYHLIAWQRYMKKRFSLDMSVQEVQRRFIGPNNSVILRNFFGSRYSDAEIALFSREKEMEYRNVARADAANLHLMDGAEQLFDFLVAREIPFALATASLLENVEFYMEELQLKRWFSMDRIVYDQGIYASKPAPDFYLEAARRIGVDPRECVIFEDSPVGIQAAANAGAGRIVVIDRTVGREALLSDARIYAVIHDFKDAGCYFIEK